MYPKLKDVKDYIDFNFGEKGVFQITVRNNWASNHRTSYGIYFIYLSLDTDIFNKNLAIHNEHHPIKVTPHISLSLFLMGFGIKITMFSFFWLSQQYE